MKTGTPRPAASPFALALAFALLLPALPAVDARQGGTGRVEPPTPKAKPAPKKAAPTGRRATSSRGRTARTPPSSSAATSPPATGAATRPSPARPTPGSVVRTRSGIELVYVPPGEFLMGSENGEADEKPVHRVSIRDGFWVGKYEVTQAQWQAVMGNNPSRFNGCDACPVEQVSWHNTQVFVRKLNAQDERVTYRLPTEAEWEYACRAGTEGDYAGSLDSMAWYTANSGERTQPVGGKRANGFGLYDMHGNVWEWVEDYYHKSYDGVPIDGSAWVAGGGSERVVRGCSWNYDRYGCRAANRLSIIPGGFVDHIGFRVVAVARQ